MSAALALARTEDANAVRTSDPLPTCVAPKRHVLVHLTSFAPGCARKGIGDPARWRQFWSAEPGPLLKSVLARLQAAAGDVALELQANGDVAILGAPDPTVLDAVDGTPAPRAPLAFICDGLSLDELETARAELTRRGWRPNAAGAPTSGALQ